MSRNVRGAYSAGRRGRCQRIHDHREGRKPMSALTAHGSTRAWRKIRAWVLRRDGYRCQVTRDGRPCHATAVDVDHIVRREHGGTDAPSNLRAACASCNRGAPRSSTAGPAPRITAGQAALAAVLDAAGLPVAAGRRRAAAVLAARLQHPVRTRDVDAACRWRRHRGPLIRI